MKNYLVLVLLFISSCEPAHAGGRRAPVQVPPAPNPSALVSPKPTPSPVVFSGGLEFKPDNYFTNAAEAAKIKEAGALARDIVHSQCFATWMSARKLIQTEGYGGVKKSPSQVVSDLQSLSGVAPVQMYYRCMHFNLFSCAAPTSAVAYRQPPDKTVHLNRAYFVTSMPAAEWAATLMHEGYGHAWGGYDHDYEWSPARSFSVPYSMGGADSAQGGDVVNACTE